MRISFFAPFKPLDHPNPSGDLVIGTGLVEHLRAQGHQVDIASKTRSRWVYWKPVSLAKICIERILLCRKLARTQPDLWLTYHSYYKAPDLLGPYIAKKLNIPYVIFQGIYSTKVRRNWKTRPGYVVNTRALSAADLVLTNRKDDLLNLKRLIPEERLGYLVPGIDPHQFTADPIARKTNRERWKAVDAPVILSAAMFRADVKTQGLLWVIDSCGRILRRGHDLRLVIAGDGQEKEKLTSHANNVLGDKVTFVGKIARERMAEFYSGGDLFVFPGINESLGMVYLEAQSCGLPVVAFNTGGVPEVVSNGNSGILTPLFDQEQFDEAILDLLTNSEKRAKMSRFAAIHVRENHDLGKNYTQLEQLLADVVDRYKK